MFHNLCFVHFCQVLGYCQWNEDIVKYEESGHASLLYKEGSINFSDNNDLFHPPIVEKPL